MGERGRYQDHARAAGELEKLCASNGVANAQGVDHLSWLLAQKNAVAYQQRRFDDKAVVIAVDKAERFSAWAYNYFKEISVAYKPVLSSEQQESRAKNTVAEFLFRQLIVPKVFLDANWPDRRSQVDIIAVDRSGAGDVHVVEVKVGKQVLLAAFDQVVASLMQIPAHFKYLALFDNRNYQPDVRFLYAPDGVGRIGVIQVAENVTGDMSADFLVRPERFRFEASFKMVDKFTASHPAYIEIRP